MKIFITIPSWSHPHGGLRVILEWANRLTEWHDVFLCNLKVERQCDWFRISPEIKICSISQLWESDCVILTSPHSSHLLDLVLPSQKCFLFLQMMEHMFNPTDTNWLIQCKKFYSSDYPTFSISQWNIRELELKFKLPVFMATNLGSKFKVQDPGIHYIGNGVNLEEFPVGLSQKDGKTVLVEGWEAGNPTKDTDYIAHEVASRLRSEGFRIIAYGGTALRTDRQILHEYHIKPPVSKLNELYTQATIMIKATKYDARACAPMEGLTKGTVTARAIIEGDDDLVHEVNCLRCGYDASRLYDISKRLLTDDILRENLANKGVQKLQQFDWPHWMKKVNDILCKD